MLELNFSNKNDLVKVCHALSTNLRADILELIIDKNLSVVEIASILKIPVSTIASNITILEKAGLIITELHSAKRGAMKICSQNFDSIHINLDYCAYTKTPSQKYWEVEMPIGHYINCEVHPTCGLADEKNVITLDTPNAFFLPSRIGAGIIWFRRGFVEYRFPKAIFEKDTKRIQSIEFSMEICSEAPGVNNDWPSDITFYLNEKELATWTSPGDFCEKEGKLNPPWWPSEFTQYGLLKFISIDNNGSYVDEVLSSNVTLNDLQIDDSDYFTFRIGVKETAQNKGGINILGKNFGNYAQDIVMKIYYRDI